ncbi:MAG: TfoX/Sxy family protein [bacterium]|nr:TfoX/Sxy family protein [bacterium]
MPTSRYSFLPFVCAALSFAACTQALSALNPTNIVWLHLDELAVNPFALSLRWKNARFIEAFPSSRQALLLRRGNISISWWRALLLGTVYFTSFDVRGVTVRLLQHQDGSLTPFYYVDPTNLTIALADQPFRRFDRSSLSRPRIKRTLSLRSQNDNMPPIVIPLLQVTNVTVLCDDRTSARRLWSLDNLYFRAERLRLPVLHHTEPWRIALGATCDGQTGKWFALDAHFLTDPRRPWARLSFAAARVRLDEPWLHNLLDLHSPHSPAKPSFEASPEWFNQCFSNPWHTLSHAYNRAASQLAVLPLLSNFFSTYAPSQIVVSAALQITFTNNLPAPGFADLLLTPINPTAPPLRILFTLTNTPPWLSYQVQ